MYIKRILDINNTLRSKSCFLLGPRQTGKSLFIKKEIQYDKYYTLLDNNIFLNFSQSPTRLREELSDKDKIVVIDEIQKLPILLDEVQYLIEEKNINFLLTGSSARKLRRGGVNLLGGRAREKHFHPFIYDEIEKHFDLLRAVNYGLIPSIYFSDNPKEDLLSYVSTYLKEEIVSEALVRNIPAFSRFLETAALCNGNLINYTNISNDAQVPRTTVQEYFQILKDTLIAYDLPPFKRTITRKAITTNKFYFFDIGVVNILQKRKIENLKTEEFGFAFEHFIFQELKAYIDYKKTGDTLEYWRSQSGHEVDFILNESIAIEVKGKLVINQNDLKGLKAIKEENLFKNFILVCLENNPRKVDDINILPLKVFLKKLWNNELEDN